MRTGLSEDKRLFELVEHAFVDPPLFAPCAVADLRLLRHSVAHECRVALQLVRYCGLPIPYRLTTMTPDTIALCTGATPFNAALYEPWLNEGMAIFDISTTARQAAFLAQVGHESGGLKYVVELWGPTPAQSGYERRLDLGNTQPGDGSRFRGHGLIQVTGRANHVAVRDRLRQRFSTVPDFEADPKELTDPRWAALSACDFWSWKGLNALADANDFERITRRINGGLNGQPDRLARWANAKAALAAA